MPAYVCQSDDCFNSKASAFGRFETEVSASVCPRCGSDEIIWCPPRYNGSAKDVDKTLRRIADRYKLSDMGQRGGTRHGESAIRRPERTAPMLNGPPVNIQGFNTSIPSDGSIRSAWTKSPVQGKLKGPVGVPTSAITTRSAPAVPTNVVGRYDGAA